MQLAVGPVPASVHVRVGAPAAVTTTVPVGVALFVLLVTVTTHLDGKIVKPKMMITELQRTVVVVVQPYWMQNAVGVSTTAAGATLPDAAAEGVPEEATETGVVGAIFAGAR